MKKVVISFSVVFILLCILLKPVYSNKVSDPQMLQYVKSYKDKTYDKAPDELKDDFTPELSPNHQEYISYCNEKGSKSKPKKVEEGQLQCSSLVSYIIRLNEKYSAGFNNEGQVYAIYFHSGQKNPSAIYKYHPITKKTNRRKS